MLRKVYDGLPPARHFSSGKSQSSSLLMPSSDLPQLVDDPSAMASPNAKPDLRAPGTAPALTRGSTEEPGGSDPGVA